MQMRSGLVRSGLFPKVHAVLACYFFFLQSDSNLELARFVSVLRSHVRRALMLHRTQLPLRTQLFNHEPFSDDTLNVCELHRCVRERVFTFDRLAKSKRVAQISGVLLVRSVGSAVHLRSPG